MFYSKDKKNENSNFFNQEKGYQQSMRLFRPCLSIKFNSAKVVPIISHRLLAGGF